MILPAQLSSLFTATEVDLRLQPFACRGGGVRGENDRTCSTEGLFGQNVPRLKNFFYLNIRMILPAHTGLSLYVVVNNGTNSVATMMISKREVEPCLPYPESKHRKKGVQVGVPAYLPTYE